MQKIIDLVVTWWRTLDPKLKYTIASGTISWLTTRYAIDLDPGLAALITLVVASVTGYSKPNDGTVLRTPQEDGNPDPGLVERHT
jgi:hypothetical protein